MRFRARSQLTSTRCIARWRRPFTALTSPAPASRSRPATAYQGHWPDARTPMRPPICRCDGARPPRQVGAPSTGSRQRKIQRSTAAGKNQHPRPRTSARPMKPSARVTARVTAPTSRVLCKSSALCGFSTLSSLARSWSGFRAMRSDAKDVRIGKVVPLAHCENLDAAR